MSDETLFEADFLARVRRLRLRAMAGLRPGGDEAAGTRRGGTFEFHEHREYSPGDDPRFLDANVAARSGRWFVKEFRREDEAAVVVAIDRSASMGFGSPAKFDVARRLAAAFVILALDGGAAVRLGFVENGAFRGGPEGRGAFAAASFLRRLEGADTAGEAGLASGLAELRRTIREPTTLLVLSDLLEATDVRRELVAWQRAGHRPLLFQILDRLELRPPWRGPTRLVDSETGDERRVDLDSESVRRIRARLHEWVQRHERFARKHAIPFELVVTDRPIVPLLFRVLHDWRLLR